MIAKTLKEFIPKWTKAVKEITSGGYSIHKRIKAEKKYDLMYSSSSCCLVGEAHCFVDDYSGIDGCEQCAFLCRTPAYNAMKEGGTEFKAFKIVLFNHMKEVHWQ